MDGDNLCLGVWQLGCAAEGNGSMGQRPLGAPARRLGLDRGPLAVIYRKIAAEDDGRCDLAKMTNSHASQAAYDSGAFRVRMMRTRAPAGALHPGKT
jgi:hypothetical protein